MSVEKIVVGENEIVHWRLVKIPTETPAGIVECDVWEIELRGRKFQQDFGNSQFMDVRTGEVVDIEFPISMEEKS